MDLNTTNLTLILLNGLIVLLIWLVKRNTDRVTTIQTDIAVIKSTIETVKSDHDSLIRLEYKTDVLKGDINAAHDKIRAFSNH